MFFLGAIQPLRQLTTNITDTYHICNPLFRYESASNPRRVLTKPSKPSHNEGYDNEDYDYILYVNDWLGQDDGHKCVSILGPIISECHPDQYGYGQVLDY